MTEAEFNEEYRYRLQERLGILCGYSTPNPEAILIARCEAERAVTLLKRQEPKPVNPGRPVS
jgi:hypothetical protein